MIKVFLIISVAYHECPHSCAFVLGIEWYSHQKKSK